jgi:hypothetical protein
MLKRMNGLGHGLGLSALAAVSVATASGSGCSTKRPTELVPGVSSQVVVPHDLQGVRVTVKAHGQTVFDNGYDVGPNSTVQLPSTLGVVSGESPEDVVIITVRGYQTLDEMNADLNGTTGNNPVGGAMGPHILRRSTQTFVDQHTLFVPMPLTYSCWNTDCGDEGMACKGNTCVDANTPESALVDYDPSLLDGTDLCFSPSACFGDKPEGGPNATVAPTLVDPTKCIYAFPGPAPLGLNVRAYYQNFSWSPVGTSYQPSLATGGEQEILNQDSTEGFTILGAGDGGLAGQTLFQIGPGLCQLVQQASVPPPSPAAGGAGTYITISALRVANLCPPKTPLLPICAGERTNGPALPSGETTTDGTCNVGVPLAPTQSALYLAMDPSKVMHGAYGPMGSARALSLSLSDPVFKRTYAAFKFLPGQASDCTGPSTAFSMPDIDFALAAPVQPQIATKLDTWMPAETGTGTCASNGDCTAPAPVCADGTCIAPSALDLQAAMRLDTGVYARLTSFLQGREAPNVAAAMFFVNRVPDLTNDCVPPLNGQATVQGALEAQILAAYQATPSLQTYFVVLDDDAHDSASPTGALTFFQKIQSDLPQAVQVQDATQTDSMQAAATAAANFSKLVTQLGTCLYDYSIPAGTDLSTVQVGYQLPGRPQTYIPQAAGCSASNPTVDGWAVDSGRLRICGASCDNLRQGILAVAGAALQANQPAPDVPVTATILCSGTAATSDGGAAATGGDAASGGDLDGGASSSMDATLSAGDDGGTGPAPDGGSGAGGDGGVAPVLDGATVIANDGGLP